MDGDERYRAPALGPAALKLPLLESPRLRHGIGAFGADLHGGGGIHRQLVHAGSELVCVIEHLVEGTAGIEAKLGAIALAGPNIASPLLNKG